MNKQIISESNLIKYTIFITNESDSDLGNTIIKNKYGNTIFEFNDNPKTIEDNFENIINTSRILSFENDIFPDENITKYAYDGSVIDITIDDEYDIYINGIPEDKREESILPPLERHKKSEIEVEVPKTKIDDSFSEFEIDEAINEIRKFIAPLKKLDQEISDIEYRLKDGKVESYNIEQVNEDLISKKVDRNKLKRKIFNNIKKLSKYGLNKEKIEEKIKIKLPEDIPLIPGIKTTDGNTEINISEDPKTSVWYNQKVNEYKTLAAANSTYPYITDSIESAYDFPSSKIETVIGNINIHIDIKEGLNAISNRMKPSMFIEGKFAKDIQPHLSDDLKTKLSYIESKNGIIYYYAASRRSKPRQNYVIAESLQHLIDNDRNMDKKIWNYIYYTLIGYPKKVVIDQVESGENLIDVSTLNNIEESNKETTMSWIDKLKSIYKKWVMKYFYPNADEIREQEYDKSYNKSPLYNIIDLLNKLNIIKPEHLSVLECQNYEDVEVILENNKYLLEHGDLIYKLNHHYVKEMENFFEREGYKTKFSNKFFVIENKENSYKLKLDCFYSKNKFIIEAKDSNIDINKGYISINKKMMFFETRSNVKNVYNVARIINDAINNRFGKYAISEEKYVKVFKSDDKYFMLFNNSSINFKSLNYVIEKFDECLSS